MLTDVRMPFWRMVVVIFKFTLAAIPAAVLVWLFLVALGILVTAVFGAGALSLPFFFDGGAEG